MTFLQNALTFIATVMNVKGQSGNPLAPAQLSAGGLMIELSRATFHGRAPQGSQVVDADLNGVPDHVEVRDLLGHKSVETSAIYSHVLYRGGRGVKGPLDGQQHTER
jgi:hypothetical protein